jgi:hypothetical protein
MLWSGKWARHHESGIAGGQLVGCYDFFGPWAFPLSAATIDNVFLGSVAHSFAFIIVRKRVFPWSLGDPYGCPQQ